MIPMIAPPALGCAAAGIITLLAVPLWRRACPRLGLMDQPGFRKLHQDAVPLAGGLAVLTGLLLSAGLTLGLNETLRTLVLERAQLWMAVLGGAALMTGLGVLDDRHVLRPGVKFASQLAVALLLAAAGLRITLFVSNPLFQHAVTALWILAVINAFNFMDNMNGLCAGLGAIAAGTFAAAAARHGQQVEVLFASLVCGALLGFLPANYPRAQVFLGDAGSHLVGFCVAVLAILPSFHTAQDPRPLAVLTPLLILAVPLLDMMWMVIVRTKAGKPFYIGDTNHLSHRLVRRGWSPPQAVALIWVLAAVSGFLALVL
ncbi:MAG: undecaprenyl/decaprenyl-phosphate alpha-N-acetylglucosaminyl 1-phosphate transferase [Verrucomicrobia bacterium]|jgi:UDP-GlcNAc:undecaprenyl-phosphate GlcNAc-1-phosphate transferase|nr:undecaprenyl/decaprenyl-phosphate alpha-N-acetylglucosaminyl 1-phosphate transferase [Verrucomicrobiota bacterium]